MIRRLSLLTVLVPLVASAQPESLHSGVAIREVRTLPSGPVRLAHDPVTDALWIVTFGGDLVRLDTPYDTGAMTTVATLAEHETPTIRGMTVGPDGAIYLVGNDMTDLTMSGVVRRGTLTDGTWTWEDVLRTETYARGFSAYDHQFSSVTLSPDGAWLFVASGSRSDHGEVQSNSGAYPDLREQPLTSALFRVPANARDLVLPADEAALLATGFLYADGFRNAFDLAWDREGELFAVDNAGDRDDAEELNWIREGHHYGFPWRIGLHDTPQQFAGYDPDEDALVNPVSNGYLTGAFSEDPTYPAPPDDVTFTDPLVNTGPDADVYRAEDGSIRDANTTGATVGSFTPHRSPLGLAFDVAGALPLPFTGDGFVLSWSSPSSDLLAPFGDEGEDVLHLQIAPDRASMTVARIARGFDLPIDAVLLGQTLYVAEFGVRTGLWALDITEDIATEPEPTAGVSLTVAPNPSRDAPRLTVSLPTTASVRVTLHDALGREIAMLHDGALAAGPTEIAAPRGLAPGVYRVRVTGANLSASTALTITR